jgi:hypothetical protein
MNRRNDISRLLGAFAIALASTPRGPASPPTPGAARGSITRPTATIRSLMRAGRHYADVSQTEGPAFVAATRQLEAATTPTTPPGASPAGRGSGQSRPGATSRSAGASARAGDGAQGRDGRRGRGLPDGARQFRLTDAQREVLPSSTGARRWAPLPHGWPRILTCSDAQALGPGPPDALAATGGCSPPVLLCRC